MSGLEDASGEFLLIALMDGVDKATIPLGLGVEVIAEGAVDERVDYIGECYENIEMKILKQEREDVLRSYAFESIGGTVVVQVHLLIAMKLLIEPV